MNSKTGIFSIFICLLFVNQLTAQTVQQRLRSVVIANGGIFGDSTQNVNIVLYDPVTGTSEVIDTIHSQSVQQVLVEDSFAFVAAQDSIVKYNLNTKQRVAATAFAGVSTYIMRIHNNHLIVGNWYGASADNLVLYNKSDLSFNRSVPEATKGVKGIAVVDDIIYFSQNEVSGWDDTLGYIGRFSITSNAYTGEISPTNYTGDLGFLTLIGTDLYSINAKANTYTRFELPSGLSTTFNFPGDLNQSNGSGYHIAQDGILTTEFNGNLAAFSLFTASFVQNPIFTGFVTAFALDTLSHIYYLTQSDWTAPGTGYILDSTGTQTGTLPVGFSPEGIALHYVWDTLVSVEALSTAQFSLFPNPASDFFRIYVEDFSPDADLLITDISGRIVLQQRLKQEQHHKIDVQVLPSGIYFVGLMKENQVQWQKLVKQ